uniref:E2 ubiquitin-conjugating enzyme n=1 Tax=Panagrellus redivivus TaxID=6233 RepID=A0A7E4VNM1_PANRE
MSDPKVNRIINECREIIRGNNIEETGISIELDHAHIQHVKAFIVGPPGTAYEGAMFTLNVVFPDDYPFRPPDVRFETNIWHPNISSQTGVICLDILKDKWAAALTLRTVLISIRALLADAEPTDPQDAVVAKQYLANKAMFDKTAAIWANHYANGSLELDADYLASLARMVEMGVAKPAALRYLSTFGWDLNKAVEAAYE